MMNQSPDVETVLAGLDTLNLTSIPPTSSTCRLSLLTAKLPDMTWSRSTIALEMMFDHLGTRGRGGAYAEVRIDVLVNFVSLAQALRTVSVFSRLGGESVFCELFVNDPREVRIIQPRFFGRSNVRPWGRGCVLH